MSNPVILEALRAPVGRHNGSLAGTRPDALYAQVLDAILERSGLDPAAVEDVITGCVSQVGEQGANIGRLAVLLSRLPESVPAFSLNRMCGSSQQAIHLGAQAIAAGDARYVLCGGVESMTRVPMFSDLHGSLAALNPALFERHELIHQGESAERVAEKYGLSREQLDEWSCASHLRAAHARGEGRFDRQIVPIPIEGGRFGQDEGIRPQPDRAKMAALRPAFRPDGLVTAGNASQIADGAAAVLLGDEQAARADGLRPRARFRARVAVGGDPTLQLMEVVPATRRALERAGLGLDDMDVIEVNEAFASVVLAWAGELGADMERVNPNGGAIAHGHPLGASGAILMAKLLHELERRDGQFGLQVMCIGHGMATATIIERI